jgi:hypothetical protein
VAKPAAVKKAPPKPAVEEEEAGEYEVIEEQAPAEDAGLEAAGEPVESDQEEQVPRKKKKKKKKKEKPAEAPVGQLLPFISNGHLGLIVFSVVGLLVCSGGLFLGWKMFTSKEPLEDPEVAIAALKAKGAVIERDEKLPDKPVVTVTMVGDQFNDSDVKHVRAFTQLRKLQLAHAPIHNHAMLHLKDLKELRYLDLSYTNVTDSGMEELAGLTNLEELFLVSMGALTDGGLSHLKGCTKLRKLHLENTPLASGRELEAAIPGLEVTK